jgi:hypothetical protein
MNKFTKSAVAACVGVLGLAVLPVSHADTWNKKTVLTVNEAIQLPGAVLQPGKYVMKLMDSPSNRHIVQVFNEREDKLITTVLALPNYRLQPTGDTRFTFWETVAGEPKPMRSWFYPGDNFGQEFAYPKAKATMIARSSGESVPTTYSTSEADLASAKVGAVNPQGVEGELDRETYKVTESAQTQAQTTPQATPQATQEMPARTQTAAAQEMPARTQVAQDMPARTTQAAPAETLPETASPLPLIGLAGLLSLGVGAAARKFANR